MKFLFVLLMVSTVVSGDWDFPKNELDFTTRNLRFYLDPLETFCVHEKYYTTDKVMLSLWLLDPDDESTFTFKVIEPNQVIHEEANIEELEDYNIALNQDGEYGFCSVNMNSFRTIQISMDLYVSADHKSLAKKEHAWSKVIDESLAKIGKNVQNHTKSARRSSITQVHAHMSSQSMNSNVNFWSVTFATVMIACALVQTFSVRRLFREDPNKRPRA